MAADRIGTFRRMLDGQVHGHAGLYVADGSVIPTSIGSHPVMTICAVAEWIAERVVASYQ
jgi:cholesterol oxidase